MSLICFSKVFNNFKKFSYVFTNIKDYQTMKTLRLSLLTLSYRKLIILSLIIFSITVIIFISSFILKDLKFKNLKLKSLQFYMSFNSNKITDNHNYNQKLELLTQSSFTSDLSNRIINSDSNEKVINNNKKKKKNKHFINKNRTNSVKTEKKFAYHKFSNERLWFMTNGSLRPDPLLSEKLAIWPNEGDPNDDRIINQLMFVSLGYSQQNYKFKTIYMSTDDRDWDTSPGRKQFAKCPVNSCEFVNESLSKKQI